MAQLNDAQIATLEHHIKILAVAAQHDYDFYYHAAEWPHPIDYYAGKAFAYTFALQLIKEQAQS
jgi:hypothetical protein